MDNANYDALIALLPEKYRAAVVAALQLIGALLAALSVVVPLIEKFVRATPSKTDDAYFEKVSRVRQLLSLFPRVIVPRLSQAPTLPAPAPELAPHEKRPEQLGKVPITWPSAERLAKLEQPAEQHNESIPPAK